MHAPPPLPSDAAARRGWWVRHWRWALPASVLTGVALLGGALGWSLLQWSDTAHASVPMREAMRRAGCSIDVVAALGEPLRADRVPSGSIHAQSDGQRQVGLRVGLAGPDGQGVLFVQGIRVDDAWDYPVMYVLDGQDQAIDLSALDDAEAALHCALQECRARGECDEDAQRGLQV